MPNLREKVEAGTAVIVGSVWDIFAGVFVGVGKVAIAKGGPAAKAIGTAVASKAKKFSVSVNAKADELKKKSE